MVVADREARVRCMGQDAGMSPGWGGNRWSGHVLESCDEFIDAVSIRPSELTGRSWLAVGCP
jgi:hypothetical protein